MSKKHRSPRATPKARFPFGRRPKREWQAIVLAAVRDGAELGEAARRAGVSASAISQARNRDPHFAVQLRAAMRAGGLLRPEAAEPAGPITPTAPYDALLDSLQPDERGEITLEQGANRAAVREQLRIAAEKRGLIPIFLPSRGDEVIFEVVAAPEVVEGEAVTPPAAPDPTEFAAERREKLLELLRGGIPTREALKLVGVPISTLYVERRRDTGFDAAFRAAVIAGRQARGDTADDRQQRKPRKRSAQRSPPQAAPGLSPERRAALLHKVLDPDEPSDP